jgi:lipopolysaccharide export system permease protein
MITIITMLIYRVIFKELVLTFLLTVIGLNLLLMMEKILKLSRTVTGLGLTFKNLLVIILLVQPQMLVFSIPLGLMLAVLSVYGRMSFENEIMVLRSSGLSLHRLFKPVLYLSLLSLILSFSVSLFLAPASLKRLRIEVNSLLSRNAVQAIEPGVFFTAFRGFTLLVDEKKKGGILQNIFILREKDSGSEAITAKQARIGQDRHGNPVIMLYNGLIHLPSGHSVEVRFREYVMKLPSSEQLIGRRRGEMGIKELYKRANTDEKGREKYVIELFRRFSFPLLIIPVILISCPLSLVSGRGGRLRGVFIGFIIYALYYTALVYFENLYRTGTIPAVSCWIPIGVFTLASLYLYWRVSNE